MKISTLIFALFMPILSAHSINLSSTDEPKNILKQTKFYIDSENKHDIEYILKNQDTLFKINKKDLIHLGYSPDAVWLKFSIKNDTNETVTKVLELSNPMLDHIALFSKEGEDYTEQKQGVLYNRAFEENILKFYFNLSLKPKETREYYLNASSLSCAVYFELNMMSKDQLYQKEINYQLILALFFGSILTLIIYNLFIYFFTKDSVYLYYVSYLIFTVLEHLSYTSLSLHIYPKSFLDTEVFLAILYISFISIFGILFVREFLNIKLYKKIDYVFKSFLAISVVFILFTSRDFYPLGIVVLIQMSSLIYIICVSFYLLYKGNENAKYMIIGWSISMLGWIMLGAYDSGMWSIIYKYPYFFELSIFTEAVLFSVALANKLNTTKELERSVKSNEILTRELHHRVKNNMQFIISMYRLKLAKFSNRDISNSLKEVEGTIQAMSATHEMLYSQEVFSNIDTKEYFNTLIKRLKQSFDTSNIEIKLNINTTLDIDTSIYVGIILNELVTNSFKYAFTDNKGQITISLSKQNTAYELIVADNGVGFDSKKESNTFGIELIKTLVADELHGKLNISTNNGTNYTIAWS